MEAYQKHDRAIHLACNVFKKCVPSVRMKSNVDNIDELIFMTKLKTVNKILNEWYAYKIDKTKEGSEYKLSAKHKFAIISNHLDKELLSANVPIIDYGMECDDIT